MEVLDSIPRLRSERIGVGDSQRSQRRDPAEADAGRRPERVRCRLFRRTPDVANVGECIHSKGAVVATSRNREVGLGIENQFLGATDEGARDVTGTQGILVETPHGPLATGIEILEYREGLPAQPSAPAKLGVESCGEVAGDRQVVLELVVGLQVPRVARDAPLGVEALERAARGNQCAVLRVTGPANGQRQRIAIARALYRNPEILILDEVTASLDSVSEQKVQETLNWFKSLGKTVIIIAHRLSTIKNCDDILVLQEGKLIEQGKHDELLLKKQHYFTMWNRFSGFIGS